jgi:hypothetical protein
VLRGGTEIVVVVSNLSEPIPKFEYLGHMKVLWHVMPHSLVAEPAAPFRCR